MVLDSVRMCGVQIAKSNLPDVGILHPNFSIAHNVIRQVLADHTQQSFEVVGRVVKDKCDEKNVFDYLWGHSKRSGFTGKLAGLLYRIMEAANERLQGFSDKTIALREIERFLSEAKTPPNCSLYQSVMGVKKEAIKEVPEEIHQKAETLLNAILEKYNSYV